MLSFPYIFYILEISWSRHRINEVIYIRVITAVEVSQTLKLIKTAKTSVPVH